MKSKGTNRKAGVPSERERATRERDENQQEPFKKGLTFLGQFLGGSRGARSGGGALGPFPKGKDPGRGRDGTRELRRK